MSIDFRPLLARVEDTRNQSREILGKWKQRRDCGGLAPAAHAEADRMVAAAERNVAHMEELAESLRRAVNQ